MVRRVSFRPLGFAARKQLYKSRRGHNLLGPNPTNHLCLSSNIAPRIQPRNDRGVVWELVPSRSAAVFGGKLWANPLCGSSFVAWLASIQGPVIGRNAAREMEKSSWGARPSAIHPFEPCRRLDERHTRENSTSPRAHLLLPPWARAKMAEFGVTLRCVHIATGKDWYCDLCHNWVCATVGLLANVCSCLVPALAFHVLPPGSKMAAAPIPPGPVRPLPHLAPVSVTGKHILSIWAALFE